MALDQSSRYTDLTLREDDLMANSQHILCAYRMKPAHQVYEVLIVRVQRCGS